MDLANRNSEMLGLLLFVDGRSLTPKVLKVLEAYLITFPLDGIHRAVWGVTADSASRNFQMVLQGEC